MPITICHGQHKAVAGEAEMVECAQKVEYRYGGVFHLGFISVNPGIATAARPAHQGIAHPRHILNILICN